MYHGRVPQTASLSRSPILCNSNLLLVRVLARSLLLELPLFVVAELLLIGLLHGDSGRDGLGVEGERTDWNQSREKNNDRSDGELDAADCRGGKELAREGKARPESFTNPAGETCRCCHWQQSPCR